MDKTKKDSKDIEKLNKLLWLDLEMTGLSVNNDVIIEAAAIITNIHLEELDVYHNVVKQPIEKLQKMDAWNQKCHRKSGLYPLVTQGKELSSVEKDLLVLIETHFKIDEKVILAGNCIYQDRSFIKKYMPHLEKKLYYRMLDVTAWKIICEQQGFVFTKQNKHRALEDTRESIKEFAFYLENIEFKTSSAIKDSIKDSTITETSIK